MRVRYRSYDGFSLSPVLVLIIVNLLLFIITAIVPELRSSLSLLPIAFLSQPWTILTSMFVHAGFGHIFANMFTLYFFGRALLGLVGQGRFLIIYFVGGLLASICYIVFTLMGGILGIAFLGSPFIPVVGASGAVFAIAGALVAMMPKLPVIIFPIHIPMRLWIAVIGMFVIFSIFGIFYVLPIAWQAHLGGLVVGLIAGFIIRRRERYLLF